jgi:hypothetical protein
VWTRVQETVDDADEGVIYFHRDVKVCVNNFDVELFVGLKLSIHSRRYRRTFPSKGTTQGKEIVERHAE